MQSGPKGGEESGSHQTTSGDSQHPRKEDLSKQLPRNRSSIREPANRHHRADHAVRGADRDSSAGSNQNGQSSPKFNGESPGGAEVGHVGAEGLDDTATPDEETNDNTNSSIGKDPDLGFAAGVNAAGQPDGVDGREGSDGIADVIGAVYKGVEGGRQGLEEGEELLGHLVVEAGLLVLDHLGLALFDGAVATVHNTGLERATK